jgi:hypothetical protein
LNNCHFPFLLLSSLSTTLVLNRFLRCLILLRFSYLSSALSFGLILRCSGMSTSKETGIFSSFKLVEFIDGCALLSLRKNNGTISLLPVFLNFMWYPCSLIFSMNAPCHFPSAGLIAKVFLRPNRVHLPSQRFPYFNFEVEGIGKSFM